VQAEDLLLDERRERQVIEQVREVLPHVCVPVFPEALIVESVDLRDLARLVVASQDGDAIAITNFQCDEERHRLDRVVPAVDVVAHEQVVGVGRRAADAEQLEEVVELP
jgi:hypothetical protein